MFILLLLLLLFFVVVFFQFYLIPDFVILPLYPWFLCINVGV